jgi:hypothetical protein
LLKMTKSPANILKKFPALAPEPEPIRPMQEA